ncbi:hypothetical protein [Micromonospora sp. WMMD998]|uniref:hypothetical protein n=1 Tax=Micromonospora sp. WMMD998 TaxID=3016092 RepID=UPI00249BDF27|nr:hypothetical protein [Micromonospora sp. WMMD998]WFE41936.1 hypothetical protein O7619_27210 [Micromonospora sp. WMMD998]
MTTEQLVLAFVPLADPAEGFEARHQVGQVRTPWTWATGPHAGAPTPQAGDLVPAWRCCHCGGIEMTRYFLALSHGCEDTHGGCRASCRYRPPDPTSRYRMDAHWVPPAGWSRP